MKSKVKLNSSNFKANVGDYNTFVAKILFLISKGSNKPFFSDFWRYDNIALNRALNRCPGHVFAVKKQMKRQSIFTDIIPLNIVYKFIKDILNMYLNSFVS